MADRARLAVFEVVDTPFARADIEEAGLYGVACLLVCVRSQWLAAVAISCEEMVVKMARLTRVCWRISVLRCQLMGSGIEPLRNACLGVTL